MFQNFGPPDINTGILLKTFIGKNSLFYKSDNLIVCTFNGSSVIHGISEFQIHIYDLKIFYLIYQMTLSMSGLRV